jgi:hypothetical protein
MQFSVAAILSFRQGAACITLKREAFKVENVFGR